MLVIYDENKTVVGLQLFPDTTDLPHIVVDDSLFESLKPLLFKLTLVTDNDEFKLPGNLNAVINHNKLEIARKEKLASIDTAFHAVLAGGVSFDFNGERDIVQTRYERDLINISGVSTKALSLNSQGVTDPVIHFRAASNTTYQMTPAQAIAMGEAVAAHSEHNYKTRWLLKDALDAAQTVHEVEAITWPV